MPNPRRRRQRRRSHPYGVDLRLWHEFMKDDTKEEQKRLWELIFDQMGVEDVSPMNIHMLGQELLETITRDIEV